MQAAELERGLLTLREAAKFLALSERTVWGLWKKDELRALKIGRSVRFYVRDLIDWIERKRGGDGQRAH